MSKYLVELELEQSFDDWLQEMRWKRNHDFKAFDAALSECQQLAREEVTAERERCAKSCEAVAADYSALYGGMQGCVGYAIAQECARKIRGETHG